MALYIKELIDKNKPRSISKFIDLYYVKGPQAPATKGYYLKSSATYFDKKCNELQCSIGRMRSFDDLYDLVKTYYPKVTVKRLFHILITKVYKFDTYTISYGTTADLYKMNKVGNTYKIHSLSNCSTMRRIRLTYSNTSLTITNVDNRICFRPISTYTNICTVDKYESKYSWRDLFDMLNIKSDKDYNDYISKYARVTELKNIWGD